MQSITTIKDNTNAQVKGQPQSKTKIKLCGYLKKKRNKVGGWRKMWFVLQDKLLLSYTSKEEYDNKLVSFKDVLNLVPGTLVRPLGGFRFTIETTTQVMYTFHCDDRIAYREWITMLLYSLASQSDGNAILPHSKSIGLTQRFTNISLDNIQNEQEFSIASPLENATSCSSIDQAGTTTSIASCVRLPIAHNTAKILERNGVNPLDLNNDASAHGQHTSCLACLSHNATHSSGGQQFRLHNTNLYQSSSATDVRKFSNFNMPHMSHSVNLINRMFIIAAAENTQSSNRVSVKNDQVCTAESIRDFEVDSVHAASDRICCTKESQNKAVMKDSIFKTTIRGTKDLFQNNNSVKKHNQQELRTQTTVEQVMTGQALKANDKDTVNISQSLEPVYAVVDLKNKYANRRIRNLALEKKRCNSFDSIIQNEYVSTEYNIDNKIKQSCTSFRDEDNIEVIYEDGESFGENSAFPKHEEENIYEPINVLAPKGSFLAYFNRLKINSLLQLNRIRKKSSDYDGNKQSAQNTSKFFDLETKHHNSRKSLKVRMRKLCFREYEPKPFFKHSQQTVYEDAASTVPIKTLKSKWKSVKLGSQNPKVFIDASKSNFNKRFFGSLPHLRKARISLFSNQHFQVSTEEASVVEPKTETS